MRFLVLCFLLLPMAVCAKSAEELRAAYLIQIPAFVKYTDEQDRPKELIYCFADKLGLVGELIASKQSVLEKRMDFKLVVVSQNNTEAIAQCSYLYLAEYVNDKPFYLAKIGRTTIAIGEEISSLKAGSLMALIQERKRIRIHINRTKLNENIVNFNARLLGLSDVADY